MANQQQKTDTRTRRKRFDGKPGLDAVDYDDVDEEKLTIKTHTSTIKPACQKDWIEVDGDAFWLSYQQNLFFFIKHQTKQLKRNISTQTEKSHTESQQANDQINGLKVVKRDGEF